MRLHIYQAKDGDWRWRLLARNWKIIADSAEGYASLRNARRAAARLTRAWRVGEPLEITVTL